MSPSTERFFRYGELPLVLIALLEQGPMSGYELMSELDRLFPDYSPSAGSVYPALVSLESEGLVQPVDSRVPKRFKLCDAGIEALRSRMDELSWIERRTGAFLRPEGTVDAELARLTGLVKESDGRIDPASITNILERAKDQIEKLLDEGGGKG